MAPAEPIDDAPLLERVESKTWKTRMEAFVELEKVAPVSSPSSPAAVPADVPLCRAATSFVLSVLIPRARLYRSSPKPRTAMPSLTSMWGC